MERPTAEAQAALEDAITACLQSPIITRWVIVAEGITTDGEPVLERLNSPGLPMWMTQGMLRWEADSLAAQPTWTQDDDEP